MNLLEPNRNLFDETSSTLKDPTTTGNLSHLNDYKDDTRSTSRKYDFKQPDKKYDQDLIFLLLQDFLVYNSKEKVYNEHKENKEGGVSMSDINWQDKYLSNLDNNLKEINQNLTNTENRISEMINKHIEYSTHLDKQRHEENLNLNNKIDKSISEINSNISSTNKWIIGLVITTIIGIAAIVVATLTAMF